MYHISDIKKMEKCNRLFWLSRRKTHEHIAYVNYNENMNELIKERMMFGKNIFEGEKNDDPMLAIQAYEDKKVLLNARFAYDELRINIPVLIQENNKTILYMTYRNCYPKETEAQYIADMISVLEQLNICVDEIYAIHLNANYIRGKELDVFSLLKISDCLYNNHNRGGHKIVDLVNEKKRDITEVIDRMKRIDAQKDVEIKRTTACTRGNKCSFYNDCFEEEGVASITNLVQSQYKYMMKDNGITRLKDADISRIEGSRHQYAQIMADRNGGLFVDIPALQVWRDENIEYPISYLDFEWETYAFPPYEGMKPYDVLTFQFSLHVEEKKGSELKHIGFIGEGDCREQFIQKLLSIVPECGTIMVFNMEGAEKLRLRQLAQQFPKYEEPLRKLWERMVDLSLPFATGNIYDVRMAGMYSLKVLVPIFSKYRYDDLAISYGMDAVAKWRIYQTSKENEKKIIYDELTQYCAMDTYAEYIVYHALENMMDA